MKISTKFIANKESALANNNTDLKKVLQGMTYSGAIAKYDYIGVSESLRSSVAGVLGYEMEENGDRYHQILLLGVVVHGWRQWTEKANRKVFAPTVMARFCEVLLQLLRHYNGSNFDTMSMVFTGDVIDGFITVMYDAMFDDLCVFA